MLGPLAKEFLEKRTVKLVAHGSPMRFEEIHEYFTQVYPLNADDLRRVLADMVVCDKLALNEQGRYTVKRARRLTEDDIVERAARRRVCTS